METFARLVRTLVTAYAATRYLVSIICGVAVIVYGTLWMFRYVPSDTALAGAVGLTPAALLAILYLIVALACISAWLLMMRSATETGQTPLTVRPIYRQTDRSGLVWLDTVLIITIPLLVLMLRDVTNINRTALTFLALLIVIPVIVDLLPAQRPRRAVTPQHGDTLAAIERMLQIQDAGITTDVLISYNDLEEKLPGVTASTSLPPGMYLEIPPSAH